MNIIKSMIWGLFFICGLTACKEKADALYALTNAMEDEIEIYYETSQNHRFALQNGESVCMADINESPYWEADTVLFLLRDTFYLETSHIGNIVMNPESYVVTVRKSVV